MQEMHTALRSNPYVSAVRVPYLEETIRAFSWYDVNKAVKIFHTYPLEAIYEQPAAPCELAAVSQVYGVSTLAHW